MTPHRKGAIAETRIAAELTRLGFDVYRPVAEGGRYDLLVDCGARLVRVQCKWAVRAGVIAVRPARRASPRAATCGRPTDSARSTASRHIAPQLESCYWLPMTEFDGRARCPLRLQPAGNGQQSGLNWATITRSGL